MSLAFNFTFSGASAACQSFCRQCNWAHGDRTQATPGLMPFDYLVSCVRRVIGSRREPSRSWPPASGCVPSAWARSAWNPRAGCRTPVGAPIMRRNSAKAGELPWSCPDASQRHSDAMSSLILCSYARERHNRRLICPPQCVVQHKRMNNKYSAAIASTPAFMVILSMVC